MNVNKNRWLALAAISLMLTGVTELAGGVDYETQSRKSKDRKSMLGNKHTRQSAPQQTDLEKARASHNAVREANTLRASQINAISSRLGVKADFNKDHANRIRKLENPGFLTRIFGNSAQRLADLKNLAALKATHRAELQAQEALRFKKRTLKDSERSENGSVRSASKKRRK